MFFFHKITPLDIIYYTISIYENQDKRNIFLYITKNKLTFFIIIIKYVNILRPLSSAGRASPW